MSDESMHEWDAAYVLGALSPDDRRRFEEHLEGCPECRASVGELAGRPALLSRAATPVIEEPASPASRNDLGGDRFETPAAQAPQRSGTLAALAHKVRRRRLTRRWVTAGASVLAAAIAAAVVLPTTLGSPPPEGTHVALAQTTPSPLSASVTLTSKRWGTEIAMRCRYAPSGYQATRAYALYVTDAAGNATRVSSWSAWPGSDISTTGAVDLPKSELRSVQVRDVATDAVLLSSPVN
jgi:hypothetical protein